MKRYYIHYNYYATADVPVLAETEEEALERAREVQLNLEDYDFTLNEESVIDEEEVPDLKSLIKEAENILKGKESIKLNPWPTVTVLVWNGECMEPIREIIENIYWDEEREEIGFETDRCSELTISDIPDIERLELCQSIIKTQSHE